MCTRMIPVDHVSGLIPLLQKRGQGSLRCSTCPTGKDYKTSRNDIYDNWVNYAEIGTEKTVQEIWQYYKTIAGYDGYHRKI